MTAPYFETSAFFAQVSAKPQLDGLSASEILALREQDFDEVYMRACKMIPAVIRDNFAGYTDREYYPDLIQAACIGVLKAVESWRPGKGQSLTTWAYRLAQQAVQKELNKELRYDERYETHDFQDEDFEDEETLLYKNNIFKTTHYFTENSMLWEAEYSLIEQRLTPFQQDCLGLLREGNTYREIAGILEVSTTTIARTVAEIQQIIRKIIGTKSRDAG